MRHTSILTACLLAAFAAASVAATSASASLPAVFECHKVTVKGSGIWNKGCKVEGEHNKELKENEWEIQEWNLAAKEGKVKPFKGTGKGSLVEDRDLEGTIKCTSREDSGEFTGPKTVGRVTVHFFGCTKLGKPCTSVGAEKAGEIVPSVLSGEIGYITKEGEVTLPPHTVGLDLHPEEEAKLHAEKKPAYQMLIECNSGAIKFRISGSLIGRVTAPKLNEFSKVTTFSYKQEEGTQALQRLEGGLKDTLGLEIFTEVPFPEEPCEEPGFLKELEAQEKHEEPVRRSCLTNEGWQTESTNKGEELELQA